MRNEEPGWLASLLGAAVLIAGGFALGLVAGVVSEEPELVVGHLIGRSDEVAWVPEGEPEFTVAGEAPGEALGAGRDPGAVEESLGVPPAGDAPSPALAAAGESESRARRPERESDPVAAAAADPPLPAVAAAPPAAPDRAARSSSSLPTSTATEPARAGFAVQVGAFSEGGAAGRVREKLRDKGFDAYVVSASASGDGRWRVRVGPVPTRAAADALAGRLKSEERLPTWVLSEGGG